MRILLRLLLISGLCCAGALKWASDFAQQPTLSTAKFHPYHVKSGQTLKPVLEDLAAKGFLEKPEIEIPSDLQFDEFGNKKVEDI